MSKRAEDILSGLREALMAAPDRRLSGPRAWMREHREAFADLLSGRRPQWAAVAAWFAENGMTNRDGRPASVGMLRSAWSREKDMWRRELGAVPAVPGPGAKRAKRSKRTNSAASPPAGAVPKPEGPVARASMFRPARARDWKGGR